MERGGRGANEVDVLMCLVLLLVAVIVTGIPSCGSLRFRRLPPSSRPLLATGSEPEWLRLLDPCFFRRIGG